MGLTTGHDTGLPAIQRRSDGTRSRHERRRTLLCIAPLVILLALITWRAIDQPFAFGDSKSLAQGAQGVVDCLRHGPLTDCDRRPDGLITGAGPSGFVFGNVGEYPPLQYVIAVPLRAAGMSFDVTWRTLVVLEAASVVGLVVLLWRVAVRRGLAGWAPALALVVATSPLLWYMTAPFGEALAALVIAAMVGELLLRQRPMVVASLVALACMTKETNPPFVLVLAALCLVVTPPALNRRSKIVVAIAGGAAIGIVIEAAFNIFRWSSPLNRSYLEHPYRVPRLGTATQLFVTEWFGPNGGMLWFWPLLLGAICLTVVAIGIPRRGDRHSWVVWAAAGLVVAELAALATWYSPFGGSTWGPRLALPLMPAIVLVAVVAAGERGLLGLARTVWTRVGLGVVGLVGGVSALVQIAVVWWPQTLGVFFHTQGSACVDARVETAPGRYYHCWLYMGWREYPVTVRAFGGLRTLQGAAAGIFGLLTVAGLLTSTRARTREQLRARALRTDSRGSDGLRGRDQPPPSFTVGSRTATP